jgi:hypothetical protein
MIAIHPEHVKQEADFHRLFERVAKGCIGAQHVAVPAADLLVGQVAVVLELNDDALGRTLGDSCHLSNVPNTDIGIL